MTSDLLSWLTLGLTILTVVLFRSQRHTRHSAGRTRPPRWPRVGLAGVVVALWVLGNPAGVDVLRRGLDAGFRPLATAREAGTVRAVVVLAGGLTTYDLGRLHVSEAHDLTVLRVLEGARVHALLGPEAWVVASGAGNMARQSRTEAEAMRDLLETLGVPADRIVLEGSSHSTREQALEVRDLLAARGVDRFVLVTSRWHLRRALGSFAAVGLEAIPSAAPDRSDRWPERRQVLPTIGPFRESSHALREYVALAYYWLRGWLAPPR